MVQYTTRILQFAEQGEKTGWTYVEIPPDVAEKLKPGNKKSFRVKGKLDNFQIKKTALLPMGGGKFIMPLNAATRKAIGKKKGAMLKLQLEEDHAEVKIVKELLDCLKDEPAAFTNFNKLPKSHQLYYSKWVESAKTDSTKTKRIAMTVTAMSKGMSYGEMMRAEREDKDELNR
ncbi:MAG: YdeI/OmpD-associated family protein [Chitinophagaceae bacterium]